ncbi:hypothetical protein OSB04_031754 [Centaurea solstitialis]|uniref:Retrovirus-related Pol polyprotein from transposon TNT 1-94-like beta-barrel domain-containing protein n=1 Tax=Centaurea solstitialis TaxID=347529 RepID=A0AA38SMA2_9ASTR|nr:hypothetical protein OSB04_031754 [Centaurea solstitialis]
MSYSAIPFYSPEESLRLIMGKWKLTGQNFPVWKLHLDNVLSAQGKLYVIEKPISQPKSNSPEKEFAEYFKFMDDESDVMSILSFSTSPEFTDDLRVKFCHEVMKDIENQVGFYKNCGKYLIMQEIFSLKLEMGQSVKDNLMEMRKLFKWLSRLGYKMTQEKLVYLIWFSLPNEIRVTASDYMGEFHEDILDSLEPKLASAELMDTDWIDELRDLSFPECGSQDNCIHSLTADQMDIGLPNAQDIFMIECLITSYESWVLDTGNGNHICNHLQRFNRRETLRKDHSKLRVGEGTTLVAEAVGSYNLSLPPAPVLELENCYYVPKMIKNIISFDLLVDQGHKSEGFEKFKEYQNEVQNQLDRKIKFLRSDRGGEYLRQEKEKSYLAGHGTIDDVSLHATSIILGHVLETTAHILNRVPTKSVEKTPYEIWTGKKPKLSFLKIWGCDAYVKRTTSEKLKPKSDKLPNRDSLTPVSGLAVFPPWPFFLKFSNFYKGKRFKRGSSVQSRKHQLLKTDPISEDAMSKEIISIGSETRPPVLVVGEYQQWKRRMINFLDLQDDKLMVSITEGPIRPTVTVAEVARTDVTPYLPAYEVEKPYDMFSHEQRARAAIDKRALTLLTMALPNDMFARVDSCKDARAMWLGIEQQMQGGDKALEGQKENAMNAYESFCAREGETLTETYNRLNICVNDLRRLGLEKNKYEVNVKFLKRLNKLWQSVTISIQVSQNLGQLGLHDLYSMMLPHEETLFGKTEKKIDPPTLALLSNRGSSSHENYTVEEPQFVGGQSSQGGYQSRENFQRNDQGRTNNYQHRDGSGYNNQGSYQDRRQSYNNNNQQQQRDQDYNSNNYHGNRGYQGGSYNQRWNDQSGSNYNNQNQKSNDDGRQHNNTGGTEPP